MPKIKEITCHKIVNSRGDWTIETRVELSDGSVGIQAIPEGASKGENEAVSIDINRAVEIVSGLMNKELSGADPFNQEQLDNMLISMDGTPNKSRLGGNSILSVSLASSCACAQSKKQELYRYLWELYRKEPFIKKDLSFPVPVFNIVNGGKHAHNDLSFQEFMVIPSAKKNIQEAIGTGVEIYHTLKKKFDDEGIDTAVGDEGGFAPENLSVSKVLDYIREAASVKFKPGEDVFFGMDVAAGSFYRDGKYLINEENLLLESEGLKKYYSDIIRKYEIIYLEDPFYEKDYRGWEEFYKEDFGKVMIVGDDLVVTNQKILQTVIEKKLINAVIVKPNQIGTLTETFKFIKSAQNAGMSIVVSHRSGDTAEDTFIADLSLAVGAEFFKSGAPVRGERVVKYNRLLDIYDSKD